MDREELENILSYINPASLNYSDWVQVGMCLKQEGFSAADWDKWSASDIHRYHAGECEKKWNSFQGNEKPVAMGTLVDMAKNNGWVSPYQDDREVGWNESILCPTGDEKAIIDPNWVEGKEVQEPKDWHPSQDLINYLEALFQPEDHVGYVMDSFQRDNRWTPSGKGSYMETAGEIIERLKHYGDDIGATLGDYNHECGAWIRFNPLDGHGVKNENVTYFRYALIESDTLQLEKQNDIMRTLNLPIACLVYSGSKSLHAIVHVDAPDYSEYRKRVDYIYQICEKNGLQLDKQNRNPSRLSRLPGAMRAGRKQFLVDTNIGKGSYDAWKEWYEETNDELPNFENLADEWDNLPEMAPPLIRGILRQGHKMLMSGPSKAGKSFALIELCISIAEGIDWLGWKCEQGKIVYVNFELDRASCLHRFKDVYEALGMPPKNLKNIDIWNLRGKSLPMDKLAPKLIRRAQKVNPMAIVLDPIYKVITGDENSADQMALFCNQFDKVCTDVGCSVIYCHHHSKGAQGGKKAIDRASGSGVFARDPDALLDLIELPLKDSHIDFLKNKAACSAICKYLDVHLDGWRNEVGQDDLLSRYQLIEYAKEHLKPSEIEPMNDEIEQAENVAAHISAWRISCTLREYMKPDDRDVYFSWPKHTSDDTGALHDIRPDVEVNGRTLHQRDKADSKESKAEKERQQIIDAYTLIAAEKDPDENGNIIVKVQDFVDRSEDFFDKEIKRTGMRKKILKFDDFSIENGIVTPVQASTEQEQ